MRRLHSPAESPLICLVLGFWVDLFLLWFFVGFVVVGFIV